MTNMSYPFSFFSLSVCASVKYTVKNTNSSRSFFLKCNVYHIADFLENFCVRYKFCENKENVYVQTLYLLEKLMLDVKVVRRAAISDGTQGS